MPRHGYQKTLSASVFRDMLNASKTLTTYSCRSRLSNGAVPVAGGVYRMFGGWTSGPYFSSSNPTIDGRHTAAAAFRTGTAACHPWLWGGSWPVFKPTSAASSASPLSYPMMNLDADGITDWAWPCVDWIMNCSDRFEPPGYPTHSIIGFPVDDNEMQNVPSRMFEYWLVPDAYAFSTDIWGLYGDTDVLCFCIDALGQHDISTFTQYATFYQTSPVLDSDLKFLPNAIDIEAAYAWFKVECTYQRWKRRVYAAEVVVGQVEKFGEQYDDPELGFPAFDAFGISSEVAEFAEETYGPAGIIEGSLENVAAPAVSLIFGYITPEDLFVPLAASELTVANDGEYHRISVTSIAQAYHANINVAKKYFGFCISSAINDIDDLSAALGAYTVQHVAGTPNPDFVNGWIKGFVYEFDCATISSPVITMGAWEVVLTSGDVVSAIPGGAGGAPPFNLPSMA